MSDISHGGGDRTADQKSGPVARAMTGRHDGQSWIDYCPKHPRIGSRAQIGIGSTLGWQGISVGLLAVFLVGVAVSLLFTPEAGGTLDGLLVSRILPSVGVAILISVVLVLLGQLNRSGQTTIPISALVMTGLLLFWTLVLLLFHGWKNWWPWPAIIVLVSLALICCGWLRTRMVDRIWPGAGSVVGLVGLLVLVLPTLVPEQGFSGWAASRLIISLALCWASLGWTMWRLLQGRTQFATEFVLGTAAALVVTLTFIAYPPNTVSAPILTELYWAALAFIGGGPDATIEPTHQPAYQMAQFVALAVLFWVAIKALGRLLSPAWDLVLGGWFSDVTLVNGLNETSLPVVEALANEHSDDRLVIIEPDRGNPLIPLVKRLGASVVIGDISSLAPDQRILRRISKKPYLARLFQDIGWMVKGRTDLRDPAGSIFALNRVYLLSDNDLTNISKAEVIRNQLRIPSARYGSRAEPIYPVPPRVIVRIDRYDLGRSYAAEQLKNRDESELAPVFASTLGTSSMTARALVHQISVNWKPKKVFVVGSSDLARAFLQEWAMARAEGALLASFTASGGGTEPVAPDGEGQLEATSAWENLYQDETSLSVSEGMPEPISIGWAGVKHLIAARDSDEVSIVLTEIPTHEQLAALEKADLDGSRARILVPCAGTSGISAFPMMGFLHYFGLSLGGLEHGAGPASEANEVESPLIGVPRDTWARAAEMVSSANRLAASALGPAGGYSRRDGEPGHRAAEDLESNIRSIWHTLRYLSDRDYTWTVCKDARDGARSLKAAQGWVDRIRLVTKLSEDRLFTADSDFEEFVASAHQSWLGFKQDRGWSRADYHCEKCQKNALIEPWHNLRNGSELKGRVVEQATISIWLSLGALASLGFVPRLASPVGEL